MSEVELYERTIANESLAISQARIAISEKTKTKYYFLLKRSFDILAGTIGSIAIAPLIIIVKVAYLISGDNKSIFFRQERIGKNGEAFQLYKFRTMVPNSDEMLREMLKDPKYKKQWDEKQKIDSDPRVTKIGRILRKTSLDELPQMINILKNEMSLIGPRPLIPGELDEHNGNHRIYEKIKPGVTSWWAAHGRSATTYEDRLELEYYYVKNCSLTLDAKCIFATIKAVISGSGAK